MADETRRLTRRERYALTTQQAIVDAARKLFAERGYFATKVDDIAAEVDVAPATVYASAGGKQGLLAELIRLWVADPAIETNLVRSRSVSDPRTIIVDLAATTRRMREQWADVIRILLTTAPHDSGVAEQLEPGTQFYRDCLAMIAQRLFDLGALREGIDVPYAADLLWFYFGYGSLFTLHDENGWSYARAEQWLADQATQELLRSP
jgi:AcrR family transcriptional regulator